MLWKCAGHYHTAKEVCLAVLPKASDIQLNIQYIANARTIKTILTRKDILYCKLKTTSAADLFAVLFQLKAFTYKLSLKKK